MDVSKTEIYSIVGKPLDPKLRFTFIILIIIIILIISIVFLIVSEYIKISDPVNG
jgi:hypothetical protein